MCETRVRVERVARAGMNHPQVRKQSGPTWRRQPRRSPGTPSRHSKHSGKLLPTEGGEPGNLRRISSEAHVTVQPANIMGSQLRSPVERITPFLRRSYEFSGAEAFRELQSRHLTDRYAVPCRPGSLRTESQAREPLRCAPHSKEFRARVPRPVVSHRAWLTPAAETATIVIPLRLVRRQPLLERAKRAQDLAVCRSNVVRGRPGECGYTLR
jgi:hypothetical protein